MCAQSQHYAGMAFDVGQNLSQAGRVSMRELAASSGIWNYVEPISLTPRWEGKIVGIRIFNS